jgi:hypothetical protein
MSGFNIFICVIMTQLLTFQNLAKQNINCENMEFIKSMLQVLITLKIKGQFNEVYFEFQNYIISTYLYACTNGKTDILNCIFENKIGTKFISRETILTGITLCLNTKDIKNFSNFIFLVNHLEVTVNEVDGNKFNLLQYCVIADNIDAFNFLLNRFKLNYNDFDEFLKEMLTLSAIHNTSRKILKFMIDNKMICSSQLHQSKGFFQNSVFMNEILYRIQDVCNNKKNIAIPSLTSGIYNTKYIPPPMRRKKTSYSIFSKHNKADSDKNWRHDNLSSMV